MRTPPLGSGRATGRDAGPWSWFDRILPVLPLAIGITWLLLVYALQAWARETPWLFGDELEFTQLARSIAETGQPARRGEPFTFDSLYTYVTAPAWWISDTASAYAAVKYLNVLLMTSVVLPVYALARLVVSKPAAMFAALTAAATPAMTYTSYIVSEPLAYPYAALCFFLIVKALATRKPVWLAAAGVAAVAASLVRTQLAIMLVVYALAALGLFAFSDAMRERRAKWSAWDWVGAALLLAGAAIVVNEVIGSRSHSWDISTRLYKDRVFGMGLDAGGAFVIGIGVLPVVATIAALFRPRGTRRTRAFSAFAATFAAAVACFGAYVGVKAAFLSTVYGTVITERNLIYLVPLFTVGMALWLDYPRVRVAAVAGGTLFAGALLVATPLQLEHPYYDAPGYAVLTWLNRAWEWPTERLRVLLYVMLASSALVMLLPHALRVISREFLQRSTRTLRLVFAAMGVFVLAWNFGGELSAAAGAREFASRSMANFPQPPDWVDEATGGESVWYLGQGISDENGIHLLEFWNRSLKQFGSLTASAPGPGPTLNPDLANVNGTLHPNPGFNWVLADNAVRMHGALIDRRGSLRLYRINPPARVMAAPAGVEPDGWMGAESGYSVLAGKPGTLTVTLSRQSFCPDTDVSARAVVELGVLEIGADKHASLGRVLQREIVRVRSCQPTTVVRMRTPRPPFQVRVTIDPTFRPSDYGSSDPRNLGAVVGYAFED